MYGNYGYSEDLYNEMNELKLELKKQINSLVGTFFLFFFFFFLIHFLQGERTQEIGGIGANVEEKT
jgi:hypothetical protein